MREMGWDPLSHPKDLTPSQNCLGCSRCPFLRVVSMLRPLEQQGPLSLAVFSPKQRCQPGLWMCSGNFPPWPCSHSLFGAQLADLGL